MVEQTNIRPKPFPEGLVKVIFDNNQKVGKTYIVTGDDKILTTAMTSSIWLTLEEEDRKQLEISYKPKNWMGKNVENKENALISLMTIPSSKFRESRDKFLLG